MRFGDIAKSCAVLFVLLKYMGKLLRLNRIILISLSVVVAVFAVAGIRHMVQVSATKKYLEQLEDKLFSETGIKGIFV